MSLCDPNRNRPVPSTGEARAAALLRHVDQTGKRPTTGVGERPCCGAPLTRECKPDCYTRRATVKSDYSPKGSFIPPPNALPPPRPPIDGKKIEDEAVDQAREVLRRRALGLSDFQPPNQQESPFKFQSIEIQRLQVKVDGRTETLFIAILDGNAVGQMIGIIQPWEACSARMLFVTPKHRHAGIGTRLVREIEAWGKEQGASSIEIAVHKGNTEGRQFWIRRRFIDDDERDMSTQPEYRCMIKPL